MKNGIYLDNASTTYPKPEEVYQELDRLNRDFSINSGRGSYSLARETTDLIENSRSVISKVVNADTCIFTSSATMAMNQVINGLDIEENSNIYYSPYEHNAVRRTLYKIKKERNVNLLEMPLNDNLEIDVEKLKYEFTIHKPQYLFCVHCSNVTGYILPIEELGLLSKEYKSCFIVDAAQTFACVDLDMKTMNIDYIVFAGHKTLYGPFGIGGICVNNSKQLKHYFTGGTGSDSLNLEMPTGIVGYEPSSQNSVAIISLAKCVEWVKKQQNTINELLDYLIDELQAVDDIIIYEVDKYKRHAIVSFNINGYKADEIGQILDGDFNIFVRTGYHCCPGIHEYLNDKVFNGTVRVSLGVFNTKYDIDRLIDALNDL